MENGGQCPPFAFVKNSPRFQPIHAHTPVLAKYLVPAILWRLTMGDPAVNLQHL